jgi:hypothetical protein
MAKQRYAIESTARPQRPAADPPPKNHCETVELWTTESQKNTRQNAPNKLHLRAKRRQNAPVETRLTRDVSTHRAPAH